MLAIEIKNLEWELLFMCSREETFLAGEARITIFYIFKSLIFDNITQIVYAVNQNQI